MNAAFNRAMMRFYHSNLLEDVMKTKAMELVNSVKGRIAAAGGIGSAITLLACNAMAVEEVADLMATADISGAKTAVYTFLVAMVAIGVLFFGRRLLSRMGVSV